MQGAGCLVGDRVVFALCGANSGTASHRDHSFLSGGLPGRLIVLLHAVLTTDTMPTRAIALGFDGGILSLSRAPAGSLRVCLGSGSQMLGRLGQSLVITTPPLLHRWAFPVFFLVVLHLVLAFRFYPVHVALLDASLQLHWNTVDSFTLGSSAASGIALPSSFSTSAPRLGNGVHIRPSL
jgi:hypothetical protein